MDPANIELASTPVPFNILLKENPIYFLIEEVHCTVQLQILNSWTYMFFVAFEIKVRTYIYHQGMVIYAAIWYLVCQMVQK